MTTPYWPWCVVTNVGKEDFMAIFGGVKRKRFWRRRKVFKNPAFSDPGIPIAKEIELGGGFAHSHPPINSVLSAVSG